MIFIPAPMHNQNWYCDPKRELYLDEFEPLDHVFLPATPQEIQDAQHHGRVYPLSIHPVLGCSYGISVIWERGYYSPIEQIFGGENIRKLLLATLENFPSRERGTRRQALATLVRDAKTKDLGAPGGQKAINETILRSSGQTPAYYAPENLKVHLILKRYRELTRGYT